MWPFTRNSEPDTRPPSAAAIAVAKSLKNEPHRWKMVGDITILVHDSGIEVNSQDGYIRAPWLGDEPEANADVILEAVDNWVAARLPLPAKSETPPAAD